MTDADPEVCLWLAAHFAARTDCYNEWVGGRQYVTVREELTGDVIARAIDERRPVGGFHPSADGTTHVGALDIDREDGRGLARAIGKLVARRWGAPLVSVDSEGGRAHLWLLIAATGDAPVVSWMQVRAALRGLLVAARIDHLDGIELRPDGYSPGTLGKGLRLPSLPHKDSGRSFPMLLSASREPLGATLREAILALDVLEVGQDILAEMAMLAPPPPQPVPVRPPRWERFGPSDIDRFNATVTVSDVLIQRFGRLDARPGRNVLCVGHRERHPSLSVLRDDKRVVCHTATCVLAGRGADSWALHTMEVRA